MSKRLPSAVDHVDGEEGLEVIESSESYTAIVRGEIDVQITTAKRYPRSISKFKDTVRQMACLDKETAAACTYALPRGSKTIYGPSVRLAEICVAAWGNLRAAARVIGISESHLTCQAVCHDLESNVAISIEVLRRITKKDGGRYDDDMIVVAGNAGSSIAYRNAIFKCIPKAYWGPIWEETRLVARGNQETLSQFRETTFAQLEAKHKLPVKAILARVGKRAIEDVDLDDLDLLRSLSTSVEEGALTLAAAFSPPPKEEDETPARRYLAAPTNLDAIQELRPAAEAPRTNGARGQTAPAGKAPAMQVIEQDFLTGAERVGSGETVAEAMANLAPTERTREELFDAWSELKSQLDARQLARVRAAGGVEVVSSACTHTQIKAIVAEAERLVAKAR